MTKQAMIFAAGLGTRLKPLTDRMPKALVLVAGEPLLAHVIRKLKAEGFTRIVVNVHHFADQIIDYLHTHDFGVEIHISDETSKLLDTGGGIRHAAHWFETDSPVLIHNVDILSNANLSRLYDSAVADAALLVSDRVTKRYLLFGEGKRLVGWTNVETGEVRSPHADLCVTDYQRWAFSGIHVVSPHLLEAMRPYPDRFPIMDFYLQNCDRLDIRGQLADDLQLLDVGKLDTLDRAESFVKTLAKG